MIKGKATIQFFDEKTGEVVRELHEENMITNAVDTILNPPDYIEIGMDSDNDRSFNMLRDFAGNLADTAFRGIIVCRDKIPEDGNNMMLPWTNEEIGHAGIANTNTDTSIGTYNANESGRIENGKGYRHVWDFASDKANGEISCICLTTKDGGTNGMHHSYWNLSRSEERRVGKECQFSGLVQVCVSHDGRAVYSGFAIQLRGFQVVLYGQAVKRKCAASRKAYP